MKEKIKSIYESLLVVTGYTRNELNERYSISSDKRIAQNILVRMLLRILKQSEVARLTGINGNAVAKIKYSDPSRIEAIIYKIVWSLYTALMSQQVTVKNLAETQPAKVKQLINRNKAIITLKDIRKNLRRSAS
jgi:hypothetical protein